MGSLERSVLLAPRAEFHQEIRAAPGCPPHPDLLPGNSWHGGVGVKEARAKAILRSLAHKK